MAPVTPSPSRGEQTRRSVLDAARSRFARDGFRVTSVTEISHDAGVGNTTAYVYFANKETLFFAAVDDDLGQLFTEVGAALADLASRDTLIEGLFPAVLEIVGRHTLARRLLAGLEPSFTERVLGTDSFAELRRAVAAAVAEAQTSKHFRSDLAPDELADGLVAVVVAVAMASTQIGPAVLDTFGAGLAALLRSVLTPDPRIGTADG